MSRKISKCICKHCSKVFYARSPLAELCSKKCANAHFRSKDAPSQADLQRLYELQQFQESA